MSNPKIAIVGSGPAGCYVAQSLRKLQPQAELCVFERLPVPYGLLRYGVAADHQGTKALTRQFDRLFTRDCVKFVGNVGIGVKLSLSDLRSAFDVTVLATGLYGDQCLDIPGADHRHVFGAGRVTRVLNAHPDEADFCPNIGDRPVVIGNGNVAIDIVRLLSKTPELMSGTDVAAVHGALHDPVRNMAVVGRSAGAAAKFDVAMVRELGRIPGLRFRLFGALGPGDAERLRALNELAAVSEGAPRLVIEFYFGWKPTTITMNAVHLAACETSEDRLVLPASSVITAIGFRHRPGVDLDLQSLATVEADPTKGKLDTDLYCTGWIRRGAQGAIPRNREDAKAVAEAIAASLPSIQASKAGFEGLPRSIKTEVVDFDGWLRIDRHEREMACADRLRQKICHLDRLVEASRDNQKTSVAGVGVVLRKDTQL